MKVSQVAPLLLVVGLAGCWKWTMVPDPKSMAESRPGLVRMSVTGERKLVYAWKPAIVGDSVIWTHGDRVAIPLKKITYTEMREVNAVAAGFFVIVGATFGLAYYLVNKK